MMCSEVKMQEVYKMAGKAKMVSPLRQSIKEFMDLLLSILDVQYMMVFISRDIRFQMQTDSAGTLLNW